MSDCRGGRSGRLRDAQIHVRNEVRSGRNYIYHCTQPKRLAPKQTAFSEWPALGSNTRRARVLGYEGNRGARRGMACMSSAINARRPLSANFESARFSSDVCLTSSPINAVQFRSSSRLLLFSDRLPISEITMHYHFIVALIAAVIIHNIYPTHQSPVLGNKVEVDSRPDALRLKLNDAIEGDSSVSNLDNDVETVRQEKHGVVQRKLMQLTDEPQLEEIKTTLNMFWFVVLSSMCMSVSIICACACCYGIVSIFKQFQAPLLCEICEKGHAPNEPCHDVKVDEQPQDIESNP